MRSRPLRRLPHNPARHRARRGARVSFPCWGPPPMQLGDRGLTPSTALLRLGDPCSFDALSLRDPDLMLYDQLVPTAMTRDPGEPPVPDEDNNDPRG